ncbi:ABC-type Na+ efflux pump permease subunit [Weissella uvarum]|uniref:ABC transporter permease n=1 Tax=Weissella uvarum TaxID=1479233 RepID=UPI003B832078|nr:ABC-type Na+ efflux pump permease subunit [Weissella uvarum]
MTKTFAIATRVLKELFRDKRTLALIFIAPMVVLALVSYVFGVNMTPDVQVTGVNLPSQMVKTLDKKDNVTVKQSDSKQKAKQVLKQHDTDAVVVYNEDKNQYDVTYANTDANKTGMLKQLLPGTISQMSAQKLQGSFNN